MNLLQHIHQYRKEGGQGEGLKEGDRTKKKARESQRKKRSRETEFITAQSPIEKKRREGEGVRRGTPHKKEGDMRKEKSFCARERDRLIKRKGEEGGEGGGKTGNVSKKKGFCARALLYDA